MLGKIQRAQSYFETASSIHIDFESLSKSRAVTFMATEEYQNGTSHLNQGLIQPGIDIVAQKAISALALQRTCRVQVHPSKTPFFSAHNSSNPQTLKSNSNRPPSFPIIPSHSHHPIIISFPASCMENPTSMSIKFDAFPVKLNNS